MFFFPGQHLRLKTLQLTFSSITLCIHSISYFLMSSLVDFDMAYLFNFNFKDFILCVRLVFLVFYLWTSSVPPLPLSQRSIYPGLIVCKPFSLSCAIDDPSNVSTLCWYDCMFSGGIQLFTGFALVIIFFPFNA